jgi:rubredoxin
MSGRCRDCGAIFDEPSFSEGPKTWDEATQTVVRFAESRFLCPECLSPNIREDPGDARPGA